MVGEFYIDAFIERLLEVRCARPGTLVEMKEEEIRYVCEKSREIFLSQPILLELEAPLQICEVKDPERLDGFRKTTPVHTQIRNIRLIEFNSSPH
ncbi:hypothetical protein PHET_08423 [Paragonimus heterotremus]|uniref:protein-serine/threonine phosphatase n=1 Tax=Paragonimus heterotremus TaxID=100268 RepID=A0A8J4SMK0_9TREM|nr:hypothetical protein PHET_08423 [Paragonimus heterotremus]